MKYRVPWKVSLTFDEDQYQGEGFEEVKGEHIVEANSPEEADDIVVQMWEDDDFNFINYEQAFAIIRELDTYPKEIKEITEK
jgi:hypothetical protein